MPTIHQIKKEVHKKYSGLNITTTDAPSGNAFRVFIDGAYFTTISKTEMESSVKAKNYVYRQLYFAPDKMSAQIIKTQKGGTT